jgi:hypothetical protein
MVLSSALSQVRFLLVFRFVLSFSVTASHTHTAEDEIDTVDPLVGGSYADPMAPARSGGGFFLEALSQLVSWPFGSTADRVDPGIGSRLLESFLSNDSPSELRSIAEQESWISSKLSETQRKQDESSSTLGVGSKAEEDEEDRRILEDLKPSAAKQQVVTPEAAAPSALVQPDNQTPPATVTDDESWREYVQQGAALKRDAKTRLEVGLLDDAAKLVANARDKFSLAAEKGYRNAARESQAANKLLALIQVASVAQKEARADATRLSDEAFKLLEQGDAAGAASKATLALSALQKVEQNYGRVSTIEVAKVVELRVRAEEKERLRVEMEAKAKEELAKKQAKSSATASGQNDAKSVKPQQAQGTQETKQARTPVTINKQTTADMSDKTRNSKNKVGGEEPPKIQKQKSVTEKQQREAPIEATEATMQEKLEKEKILAQKQREAQQAEAAARAAAEATARELSEKEKVEAQKRRAAEQAEAAARAAAAEAAARKLAEEEDERERKRRETEEAAAKKEEALAALARQREGA